MVHVSDNHFPPEEEALLADPDTPRSNAWRARSMSHPRAWKAHPFWLIPIVLVFSMSRGITMAPRIKVYTDIACRVLDEASPSTADCSRSEVQARAARIQAMVVTIMSILSAVTTGFWSRFGDRHGRKPILSISHFGALAMDVAFLIVSNPNSIFGRHAETFILLGPVLDGFVGGLSAFNGVVHAYTSDCTRHGSRSKIFSTVQGIVFVGLAMGPWIGTGFAPANASNNFFFYLSASLLTATFFYILFVLPESRHNHVSVEENASDNIRDRSPLLLSIRHSLVKFGAALLLPIAMFKPRPVPGNISRKNYNLTFLGLGLFMYLISIGIYSSKYLYAQHIYSWSTKELGYYLSLLWVSRAFNLLVFLPIVISYLKPKGANIDGDNPTPEQIAAELQFDKNLARCSLAVDGLADFCVAITPTTSQASFVTFSCVSSFTSGGNPALHSLGAVCLHAAGYSSEVGSLFGAMAVLSAIAHIISPTIYAVTYASTVAYFPQAIFYLAATLLASGVILLGGIRSGKDTASGYSPLEIDEHFRDSRDSNA